jgi:hypothetical protein
MTGMQNLFYPYIHMADVISHRTSECTACKTYVLHLAEASMDNEASYLDALTKRESHWVPMHELQRELQHLASLAHDLEDCQDEIEMLRRRLKESEAPLVPSTFARVAAASGTKPLTRRAPPALPVTMSMGKKPVPIATNAGPSTVPAAVPPATQPAGASNLSIAAKDKGKGHALPGPYLDELPKGTPSFEEDPYGYFLSYDDDETCAAVSDTARHWSSGFWPPSGARGPVRSCGVPSWYINVLSLSVAQSFLLFSALVAFAPLLSGLL